MITNKKHIKLTCLLLHPTFTIHPSFRVQKLGSVREDHQSGIFHPLPGGFCPPLLRYFSTSFIFLHLADACISKSINSSVAAFMRESVCGPLSKAEPPNPRSKCICCKWPCLWAAVAIDVPPRTQVKFTTSMAKNNI